MPNVNVIDAKEVTIKALLDSSGEAYKVPRHQRQFEWTTEQWQDLWDDVHVGTTEDSHFLGSIVVIPQQHRVGINYFEVNDGQQRLTTILIFLAAIRDLAKKSGNAEFAQFINEHYLTANYFEGGAKKVVAKMSLGKLDEEQFKKIIEGRYERDTKNQQHRIFECYNFFWQAAEVQSAQLEELLGRIVDKIIVVHINVANQFNAFRLFETLNDRGLALSAVDLIKNNLLMRAARGGNETVVDSIVDEWQEMYERIRSYDPVSFLHRFMLAEFPGKVAAKQLYVEISDRADKENWGAAEIAKFTNKLNKAAAIYTELIDSNTGLIKIDRRLADIRLFEAEPSYILLLKVTPLLKNAAINEDDYLKVLDLIEAFHIRWGICGQSTSRLYDIYNRMCTKLNTASPDQTLEIIESEYLSSAAAINDLAFAAAFAEEFRQPSAPRTKFILWKLGEPAGEVSLNFDEVHTEHILPQTLSAKWLEILGKLTGMDDENVNLSHELLINKIGNLALIKGEWNISMSNRPFDDKKNYYSDSEIRLTKELTNKADWKFDDIISRTRFLSDKATQIWKFNKPISAVVPEERISKGRHYPLSEDIKLFCKGPSAEAEARIIGQKTIRVLKDSRARKNSAPGFETHNYKILRDSLVSNGVLQEQGDSFVFDRDYEFESASAAAAVVLGRAADGKTEWKNEDGTSIYELTEGNDKSDTYGREYWVKKTGEETMLMADSILTKIRNYAGNYKYRFNKNYIGINDEMGTLDDFIYFIPGKEKLEVRFWIEPSEKIQKMIDDARIEDKGHKNDFYRLRFNKSELQKHEHLIDELMKKAGERE